ncbi:low molecular weight protein arginine phosphatase [Desmospora profundinema]|uniref:Protein-tyrosine phosphatase n=1 Tax=Desmospora profundinema TaxID=1571184 RepID=A0ABU1ILR1_9BACL|nr:low molecular weight protein arginine phosphatase [Desmospora profundinema]MDR6225502.1 protein-tyrosine phosphatase [Desmospora profundinema]
MKRFLFICTGNTCRSPMAEALLRKRAAERGLSLEVKSAGVSALPGGAASFPAVEVLKEKGIDHSDHRSQPVTAELLDWADVVLTMTRSHRQWLIHSHPIAVDKAYTLKEWILEREADREQRWRKRDQLLVEVETRRAMKARAQADGDKEKAAALDGELRELAQQLEEVSEGLDSLGDNPDVADPFGGDTDRYRKTAEEIEAWVNRLVDWVQSQQREG